MSNFDKKIVIFLNQHRWKKLDYLSVFLNSVPSLVFFWFLVVIFAFVKNHISGIYISLGLAIVFIIHFAISEGVFKIGGRYFLIQRLRPYKVYLNEIEPIGKKFSDSSFPSSHMSAMTGGFFVLKYFYPFIWPAGIFVISVMGWSRIRDGMHYPSDVLAGIFLGIIYGYIALTLLKILI